MTGGRVVSNPRRTLGVLGVLALTISACSSGAASSAPASVAPSTAASVAPTTAPSEAAKPVTIDWWHIQNNDPGKALWQSMADAYTAAHPNVTIKITVLENAAFKPKLTTQLQGGDVPDLFQSWGGGGLGEQVTAGLVKDITGDIASWKDTVNPGALGMYQVDGKQYGVPFDLGMVGFWYNKDLFTQASITAPPATWDDLLADVDKLKAANITPLALGGKEEWPGMFWWAYLAVRAGGKDAMDNAIKTGDWSAPGFVAAGKALQDLIAKKPFQAGFLAAPWDGAGGQAATMANGKAAFQLMGQWAPGTMQNLTPDKKPVSFNLGWFGFPSLASGAGAPTDGFGGGNGFAVGKDAPPEAIDFLKFINNSDNAAKWGPTNSGILSTTVGAESTVTDPNLTDVLAGRAKATFVQLYLDQATTPALGQSINDAIQTLYAGTGTPEKVTEAITAAAKAGG
jgi:raffinose/stachyose/melibiose transport system substrate-binding protein